MCGTRLRCARVGGIGPLVTARRYIVMVMLLLAGVFGNVHASAYGGEAHSHDGVVCDLGVVEEVGDIALPPTPVDAPVVVLAPASWLDAVPSRSVTPKPARAPPQRGPPQLS